MAWMQFEDLLRSLNLATVSTRCEATVFWNSISPHTGGFLEKLGFHIPHIRRAIVYKTAACDPLEEGFRVLKDITVSSVAAIGLIADLSTTVRNKRLLDTDRVNVGVFFGKLQDLIFPINTFLRLNLDCAAVHIGGHNIGKDTVPWLVCLVSADYSEFVIGTNH